MKARYDLIAEQWISLRHTFPPKDLALFELFEKGLPEHGQVLDLGCGHGTPVAAFLSGKGHAITGVDRSGKLLAQARQSFPEHIWEHCELEDYQPSGSYDGVVIWDSMFHLPRNEHLILLRKVSEVLQPGGLVILSSGGLEEDLPGKAGFTDFMFDVEFFYDAFPTHVLHRHCENMGFEIVCSTLVNEPDGGRDKGRLGLLLRKC